MPIKTLQKNVTASGTPEQLNASYGVQRGQQVVVKAKLANTGTITVGPSSADALNSSASHFKLRANESLTLSIGNLNEVYIDATVSGEGVEIIFEPYV